MRSSKLSTLLPLLALASPAISDKSEPDLKPCTVYNPINGNFYDLNGISLHPPKDPKKVHKDERIESWHARGYDYNTNFTLNICAPVVEKLDNVVGIDEDLWKNVSAFYTVGKKTYSIGQNSAEPMFRGRKLLLNYTDGSPCGDDAEDDGRVRRDLLSARKLKGDDDDDEEDDDKSDSDSDSKSHKKKPSSSHSSNRRKSTIISFLCDRDALNPTHASFIAASPDSCTYFFEVRSSSACGGAIAPQQSLAAGGVFSVIALVAIAVYLLGGIAYQRTVMHQRGWRQLPNYALWAGIGSFVSDMFWILFGSCARFLPLKRRGGYDRLNGGSLGGRNGGLSVGGGRRGRTQEENGLIDSLDEEWND